ncbi:MAG: hypothetical protein JSW53_05000 [Candidatus Bathyarchaeota archaeon]|nr:MAG: hypothetical protein JSW53_05000 [Candidatus Bathyarchaeota archaeon]
MGRYRSRLEIIADVLGVVKGGARKTRIMYQANLSYRLLTRYLDDVMDMGLVKAEDEGIYELTEKGIGFLQEFKGYNERRADAEDQLNNVKDEELMLENRFLNSRKRNDDSKNRTSSKEEERRLA